MQVVSFILSVLGFAAFIGASLTKGDKMKQILFLVSCANVLYALSYLAGGSGINGAASCLLGGVMAIINYFFDSKNKPVPKWLMLIYAVAVTALNIYVGGGISLLVLLTLVACYIFILCIGQKDGAKYRFWTIVNLTLWSIYDILSHSYGTLLAHLAQVAFTVVGMVIYDRKKIEK